MNEEQINQLMQMFTQPQIGANIGGGNGNNSNLNLGLGGAGNMFGENNPLGNFLNLDLGRGEKGFGPTSGASATTPRGLFGIDALNSEFMGDVSTGFGAAKDLFGLYAGMKGLGLADKQVGLAETNLNNQAKVTNERLGTREASRLRSRGITGDANAAAVAEFMGKNSVAGA